MILHKADHQQALSEDGGFVPFPKENKLYGARDFQKRRATRNHDHDHVDFSMIIDTPRNYVKYAHVGVDADMPPDPNKFVS